METQATPPTKEYLLARLRRIEAQLSPENLYMDGERARSDARRAERALNKERAETIKQLGYEPDFKELYGRL